MAVAEAPSARGRDADVEVASPLTDDARRTATLVRQASAPARLRNDIEKVGQRECANARETHSWDR
jgi:hypothetical protein